MTNILPRDLRTCDSKRAFQWVENSCYMDTVLWVLFRCPNRFIDSKLLFSRPPVQRLHRIGTCAEGMNDLNERVFMEFQAIFRRIALFFRRGRGDGNCTVFRRLYGKWYNDQRCMRISAKIPFHQGDQNEAQEFLQFLLSLYGMNGLMSGGAVSIEKIYYGVSMLPRAQTYWTHIFDRKDRNQSLVWSISHDSLRSSVPGKRDLSDFLTSTNDTFHVDKTHKKCCFNAVRSVHRLTRFAPLVVLSLDRVNPLSQKVLRRRVSFPREMNDDQGNTVRLFGIICHDGAYSEQGHYTAFASYGEDEWWFYDDLRLPLERVGSFDDLCSIRSISSSAVLFFYSA